MWYVNNVVAGGMDSGVDSRLCVLVDGGVWEEVNQPFLVEKVRFLLLFPMMNFMK